MMHRPSMFKKLSKAKKAILARLATEGLVDKGDGYILHASHCVV